MRADQPVDDVDSEWVDVEDDHDDEIVFKVNTDPDEWVPDDQLDDTLPYVPSPRQQDECQDQHYEADDNFVNEKYAYNDYQTLDPPDQFDNTFYMINDYWDDDDNNEPLGSDDTIRQVDNELDKQEQRYVTHIQDGYTVEQSVQEGYDSDTEAIPSNRAQEILSAYPDLNLMHATEVNYNWAPTPVKVVGPELELHELYFHEEPKEEPQDINNTNKKEPFSPTSTLKKKPFVTMGEEIYPLHPPTFQSRSTAKLTNMVAEDLPNSEEKTSMMPLG